jgi:hypothetical protein
MPSGFNLDLTYAVRANKNPPYSFKAGSMSDDYFPFRAGCVSDGFFPDFKKISPSGRSLFFSARHKKQMKSAD